MSTASRKDLPAGQAPPVGYDDWFEFLVDNVQDIITVIDTDGTIQYESPSIRVVLGYSPEEMVGRNAFSFIPEEEVPGLMQIFEHALAHPEAPQQARFRFRHADGSWRHLDVRAKVIVSDGESQSVVVTSRDVTDRVAAEQALRRSEERNRALLNAIPDAMVRLSRDGTYLDVSIPTGYTPFRPPQELIGANVRDLFDEPIAETAMRCLEEAIDTGSTTQFEYELEIDGRRVVREARIVKSGDAEAISIQRDITEAKRIERALRQSESSFRALFENSPDAVFVEDLKGFVLDVNPAAARLHRMSRRELIGKHVAELVPEDIRESVRVEFSTLAVTPGRNLESYSLAADGTAVPVEISVNSFRYGETPALMLTVRDVTRRKLAEEELVRLETFYRTILDELPADLAVLDADGRMIYLNPSSVRDPEMRKWLIGKTGYDYCRRRGIDTALADRRVAHIREAIEKQSTVSFEEVIEDRSGRPRHILRLASPIVEADGSINYVIGYGLEITELKEAQSALRDSEALLRSVVTNMPVAVIATGGRGAVRVLEGQGLEAFDLEPGHGLGQHLEVMFAKVPEVVVGFRAALQGEQLNRRIAVGDHSFEFWYHPRFGPDDHTVNGVVAVAADVTDITRKEADLRESREQLRQLANRLETVREEERARIAREVHDVLGQAMTGLRMDIGWLAQSLGPEQAELFRRTESMGSLITDTIKNIRRIATDLRPGILDDLGLAAAIQWQARDFENRTDIAFMVSDETESLALDREQSTAVFRIFQEILTNVARHARATAVDILLRERHGRFEMRVADDGIGIKDEDIAAGVSLGLLGIKERVAPWGGEVTIEGREGQGTTVNVSIPIAGRKRP